MKVWNNVAIIGVGLIGGSIGLALLERGLTRSVIGIGRRSASLRKARRRGAVTSTTTQLARGVADADLIVVCTPIENIVEHTLQAAAACRPGTLITDVGSTKASIVDALDRQLNQLPDRRATYVGSHPMAGSEKTGVQHARPDLFERRVVVVTPSRRTPAAARNSIEALWKSVGAVLVRKSPQAHDRTVAAISHLPHLAAAALAATALPDELPLVGGGWLDTTRVAAGDVELWRQILRDNRQHVLNSLSRFEKVLGSYRRALESISDKQLIQLLERGKHNRDAVGD